MSAIDFRERFHSEAKYPHKPGYFQATDPFPSLPVLAGTVWIDTSGGAPPWPMKIRSEDNTTWEQLGGAGGHIIQVNDDFFVARAILRFVGPNVFGTDDATNNTTIITIVDNDDLNLLLLGGDTLTLGGERLTLGGA